MYGFDNGDCCDEKHEDWDKRCGSECVCFDENLCNPLIDSRIVCQNETWAKICDQDCEALLTDSQFLSLLQFAF